MKFNNIKIFVPIIFSFIGLLFSTAAFADSTGMKTSFKVTIESINAEQIKISWETIPDVKEYRICVADKCQGPDGTKVWITIYPNQTDYVFNLPAGKMEVFWVHALMESSSMKWTETDTRPNLIGTKWDMGLVLHYTNNYLAFNTATIPETTTTIVKEKKIVVPKTIATIPETTTTIVKEKKIVVPKTITTTPKQEKEQALMFGLKVSEFIIIMSILAMAFICTLIQQMLNFKIKKVDKEHERKIKLNRFELEKVDKENEHKAREYELKELAKTKLDNEHEQALKKIDHDVLKDRLGYTDSQLKDEREFNLEQQKITAKNTDQVLNYIMPILQGRDRHELRMAEIKASSANNIIGVDDITEAKVKFKK
jgi:hypothetical protein